MNGEEKIERKKEQYKAAQSDEGEGVGGRGFGKERERNLVQHPCVHEFYPPK